MQNVHLSNNAATVLRTVLETSVLSKKVTFISQRNMCKNKTKVYIKLSVCCFAWMSLS